MSVDIRFEFMLGACRNFELVYTTDDRQLYKFKLNIQVWTIAYNYVINKHLNNKFSLKYSKKLS